VARNSLRALAEAPSAAGAAPGTAPVALPEDLTRLLRDRAALEAQMAALSGGAAPGAGGDPRFPVTPLSARRAADAEWARRRDAADPAHGIKGAVEAAASRALRGLPGDDALGQMREGADRVARARRDPRGALREAGLPERTRLPERTGLPERNGLRAVQDALGRADQPPGPPGLPPRTGLRDLVSPEGGAAARLDRALSGRPRTDLTRPELPQVGVPPVAVPALPVPQLRPLPSDRLDVLRGGSGDLDALRRTALARRRAKDPDARRDAARLARGRRDV
jgi:hypothetical protein